VGKGELGAKDILRHDIYMCVYRKENKNINIQILKKENKSFDCFLFEYYLIMNGNVLEKSSTAELF
jgi:hypothetical protein